MSTSHVSQAGARLLVAALLAGSTLLFVPVSPADAAPRKETAGKQAAAEGHAKPASSAKEAKAKIDPHNAPVAEMVRDPQYTSSTAEDGEGTVNCVRPRKRLWVEGEGWIVRRVTICP